MNVTLTITRSPAGSVADQLVLDTLRAAGFSLQSDGWFYPAGSPDRAAVRISVYGGQYRLERRRKPHTGWMSMAVADTTDFDTESFRVWRSAWPLSF